jgi:2-(3-amino-3-carboxypropyl)histidine synthase
LPWSAGSPPGPQHAVDHSPVPIDQTNIKTLYVFVEIAIDSTHLAQTVRLNFPNNRSLFRETLLDSEEMDREIPAGKIIGRLRHLRIEGPSTSSDTQGAFNDKQLDAPSTESTRLVLVSTIQFVVALQRLKDDLNAEHADASLSGLGEGEIRDAGLEVPAVHAQTARLWTGKYEATIPRSKPLSPGEVLGCTAPPLGDVDALMCVKPLLLLSSARATIADRAPPLIDILETAAST